MGIGLWKWLLSEEILRKELALLISGGNDFNTTYQDLTCVFEITDHAYHIGFHYKPQSKTVFIYVEQETLLWSLNAFSRIFLKPVAEEFTKVTDDYHRDKSVESNP